MHERYVERCPIGCGASLLTTDIVLPEGPLLRCADCGQLTSQASAERYWETMAQFDQGDFNQPSTKELERRSRVAARRLNEIARLLDRTPPAIRVLDVGCSRGHFVASAMALGFHAEGVEPAPHIAATARAAGLKVHEGLLEDQRFAEGSFDALTLFEVVEHLKDPRSLLRECRRVLRRGGVLLISTGNAASWTARVLKSRWDYFQMAKDGGHVSFFNPRSLRRLAQTCGFTVERIETARVNFHDSMSSTPLRAAMKGVGELLNLPARVLGRGHDMLAYLRRA